MMRSGCRAQSLCIRSTRRITNGSTRCTRARSRASNNLARFSLHGINGLPLRSRTKTATLILSSTTTGGRPARVIRYCLSPPGDCPYGPCNGSLAAPLPSAMLHSSFGSRLAVARFVPPVACLLLPLAEQRTEEAFAGASFTSVQRSAAFCTEPGQSGLAPFFASPHYNARAFSGGLLT